MFTIKTSGLDGFADQLKSMADRLGRLDGTREALRCPDCGSTTLFADDDLGDDAPVRCENGHILGAKRDIESLVMKQTEQRISAALKG